MKRLRIYLLAVVVVVDCTFSAGRATAQGEQRAREVDELVRSGLAAGLAGDSKERRDKLEAALSIDPESTAAHWHLGHVRVGDEWKTIAEAEELAMSDAKLKAYLKQRARYGGSVEGEARLAAWCQRNGLKEQSQAHWYQVLRYDPNGKHGKRALVALDATWYRGTLMSKELADHQRRLDESIRTQLRNLKGDIRSLRQSVLEGNKLERALALAELKKIRGDAGVVAITQVLMKPTEDAEQTANIQIEAMKLLGGLDSTEAVRVLTWHAAMSPYESVREAVRKELSRFPLDEYVPVLLAGMKMPVEVSVTTRIVGTKTATTLAISREGPNGQQYEDQLQSIEAIGGSPTFSLAFESVSISSRPTSRLVNM